MFGDLGKLWDGFTAGFREFCRPIMKVLGFENETLYKEEIFFSRAFPDDSLPEQSSYQQAILKSVSNDEYTLPQALQEQALTGLRISSDNYMYLGKTNYIYGLPTLGYRANPIHEDEFIKLVELDLAQRNYTVKAGQQFFKIPDMDLWVLYYLQRYLDYTNYCYINGHNYSYFSSTKITETLENTITLEDGTIETIYTEIFTGELEVTLQNVLDVEDTTTIIVPDEYNKLHYIYVGWVTHNSKEFQYIFMYVYNSPAPMSNSGITEDTTGMCKSSIIDPIHEGTPEEELLDLTEIYPIVPIKQGDSYNKEGHEAYSSSVSLLNEYSLDLDEFVSNFESSEEVKNIKNIFFMMGVSLYDDSPEMIDYLYNFFKVFSVIIEAVKIKKYNYSESIDKSYNEEDTSELEPFIVNFQEQNYNIDICFRDPTSEIFSGKIGEVGYTTKEYDIKDDDFLWVNDASLFSKNGLIFKRQITETSYEVFTVNNVCSRTVVLHEDGKKGLATIALTLPDTNLTNNIIIPLSHALLKERNLETFETIILKSFYFAYISVDSKDLEYWQTEQFNWFIESILLIITIVITIWSLNSAGWTAAAFSKLILAYMISESLKAFLKSTKLSGVELAIVLIAYAIFSYYASGESGFVTNLNTVSGVLKAITYISDIYVTYENQETKYLLEEIDEEKEAYESWQEQLKEIEDGLATEEQSQDYLMYRRVEKVPYGTAEQYYNRTLATDSTEFSVNYAEHYCKAHLDMDTYLYKTI